MRLSVTILTICSSSLVTSVVAWACPNAEPATAVIRATGLGPVLGPRFPLGELPDNWSLQALQQRQTVLQAVNAIFLDRPEIEWCFYRGIWRTSGQQFIAITAKRGYERPQPNRQVALNLKLGLPRDATTYRQVHSGVDNKRRLWSFWFNDAPVNAHVDAPGDAPGDAPLDDEDVNWDELIT